MRVSTPLIEVRPITVTDLPFVFSSWLKSQRRQGERAYMTNRTYFQSEKRRITELLDHSGGLIAYNPDDVAQVYGYLIFSIVDTLTILHFGYVKKTFRRFGIMRRLVTEVCPDAGREEIGVTHISPEVLAFKHRHKLVFDPSLTRFVTGK